MRKFKFQNGSSTEESSLQHISVSNESVALAAQSNRGNGPVQRLEKYGLFRNFCKRRGNLVFALSATVCALVCVTLIGDQKLIQSNATSTISVQAGQAVESNVTARSSLQQMSFDEPIEDTSHIVGRTRIIEEATMTPTSTMTSRRVGGVKSDTSTSEPSDSRQSTSYGSSSTGNTTDKSTGSGSGNTTGSGSGNTTGSSSGNTTGNLTASIVSIISVASSLTNASQTQQLQHQLQQPRPHPHAGARDSLGNYGYVANITKLRSSMIETYCPSIASLSENEGQDQQTEKDLQSYDTSELFCKIPFESEKEYNDVCEVEPGQGYEGPKGGWEVVAELVDPIDETMHWSPRGSRGARQKYNSPSVLCAVYTYSKKHNTQVRVIAETWGWRCDGFFAASTKTTLFFNDSFPNSTFSSFLPPDGVTEMIDLLHEGPETYGNMWQKTRSMLAYMYDNYLNDFDYFFLCGDDTHVIVENLKSFLWQQQLQHSWLTKRKEQVVFLRKQRQRVRSRMRQRQLQNQLNQNYSMGDKYQSHGVDTSNLIVDQKMVDSSKTHFSNNEDDLNDDIPIPSKSNNHQDENHGFVLLAGAIMKSNRDGIFLGGGGGYVMSREALKQFVEVALPVCHPHDRTSQEDIMVGKCFENILNVSITDAAAAVTLSNTSFSVATNSELDTNGHPFQNSTDPDVGKQKFHGASPAWIAIGKLERGFFVPTIQHWAETHGYKSKLELVSSKSISFHNLRTPLEMKRHHAILYSKGNILHQIHSSQQQPLRLQNETIINTSIAAIAGSGTCNIRTKVGHSLMTLLINKYIKPQRK